MSERIPCGKCPPCIKRKSFSWVFRLREEYKVSTSAEFYTLTYENMPTNGSLNPRDLELFIKRLRKEGGKGIKYYAVGEYGSLSQRPHYHAIMYNIPERLKEAIWLRDQNITMVPFISEIWSHGFVDARPITEGRIAYVAGYCDKKLTRLDPEDDRIPEFNRMSKGLGLSYLTDNKVGYYKKKMEPYIRDEYGKKLPMPRYYKKKMFNDFEQYLLAEKSKKYIEENLPEKPDFRLEVERKKSVIQKHARRNNEKRLEI